MKNIKLFGLFISCMILIASCNMNEMPKFDDKDAFVAFTATSLSIPEDGSTLEIPVLLSSLSGISTTVDFEIDPDGTTAREGVNFTFANQSHTLSFTKEAPEQKIVLNIIDNDTFDGDVRLNIMLKEPQNVNLGASKTCQVTIGDNEHPLALILGTFTAIGESYYDGESEWNVTIDKDTADVSKVWISNFVPGGSNKEIYGVVNEDLTELRIPVKQVIAETNYPLVILDGYVGEDGETDLNAGESITCTIDPNGKITVLDWFASSVYNDSAGTQFLGYYNLFMPGVTLTKN